MVSPLLNPTASWEFEGEILVLHHPTTISTRYQAMGNLIVFFFLNLKVFNSVVFLNLYAVHCGSLRKTAQIQSMSQECLRTGDKALVHFRFIKHPEYIKPGLRLVFREGRTKAVGNVVRAIPHASQTQSSNRSKPAKMQRYSSQQQVFLYFIIQNYIIFYLILNFVC